jgi:type IV pilus assembly protein PilV
MPKSGTVAEELSMNEQSGFTLLEVLIALLIFTAGLLAVASMQVTAIRGNNHSAALTEASYWGSGQMESLLSLPYTDADLSAGDHPDPPLAEGIYNITWHVEDKTTETKEIDVRVAWTDRGDTRIYELTAVKAR